MLYHESRYQQSAVELVTRGRIHHVNTKRVITAEVSLRGNKADVEGGHYIPDVPCRGAKILLDFSDSAGTITGKLLPTGNVRYILNMEGEGDFGVSFLGDSIRLRIETC